MKAVRSRRAENRRIRRNRPALEFLEQRVALTGILNGDFSITDPSNPQFGYVLRGGARIADGQGILDEGSVLQSGISQTFTIAPGTEKLRFSVVGAGLLANGNAVPPDAFEVALLNASTMQPLVGPPVGLTDSDAFLNIQRTGEVYFGAGVTVPGASTSGQPATLNVPYVVTVDVSGIAAGTQALLSFDLIGFSPITSSMRIDDIVLVSVAPPLLTMRLDPASDSGVEGDNVTKLTSVDFVGNTDPNQILLLDIDGDGFDDGQTTADATGLYRFQAVALPEGVNQVRTQATNPNGSATAATTVTIDSRRPTGVLVLPVPDSTVSQDAGYVEIQWTDLGDAGLDASTFGIADITISGVSVDSIESLGGGRIRYRYNTDGDVLSSGQISVSRVADQVFDLAGNGNLDGTESFTVSTVVNRAPSALSDSYNVDEGTVLTVTAPGVLSNDTDPDGDSLTAVLVTQPTSGTLALNANGSFTYTPNAGFVGTDSFSYRANDGSLDSGTATVTIQVLSTNSQPIAANDSFAIAQNTVLNVAAPGVLSNDSDPDGDALTAVLVSQPSSGSLTLNANGSFTYTPNTGFVGTDSFSYRANDGSLNSGTATVTIQVQGTNSQPIAANDTYAIAKNAVLNVVAPGVLSNDSDPDGNALTAILVSQPTSGSLTLNSNGSFSYTPNTGFVGNDSFTYRANDGSLNSGSATVTIQVQGTNSQPITANDSYAIAQNAVLNVSAPGVLSNDSDPDGDTLTAVLVTQPTSGTLALNANGSFTYTPNAGFVGTDSFTYRANDGSLNSSSATVTIQVQGTNSQPIAANDTYAIAQNNVLNVSAPGVLSNDSDPDGDALTAILVSQPSSGSLTLNANGSFTYTPNSGFVGSDSFTYRANDGSLNSGTATVSLVVTAIQGKPVITDSNLSLATASIFEGGTATLSGQFLNPNPAAKHTLRIDWKDGKPIQTIELAAGIRTFGPITRVYADDDPTATPQDAKAIFVTVTDEQGQTDSASVVLTVVNVAPVIDLQDTISGMEGSPVTIQPPTVSDPGVTDTFTYLWEVKNPAGNVVATSTTSNLTFVPADDGTFTVRLTITDDDTGAGTTTTTLVVSDVPPTLTIDGDDSTITSENFELTLSANDPGADTIASWTIDWGDGTVETVSGNPDSAQHTYRLPGGITLPSIPESRFIDYLRRRRSLDPARFDHYHPWLGLVFRAEENPTVRLPNMRYFDVARQRRAISQGRFDRHHPLLGYMLALEEVPAPTARQVTIKATATNEDGTFRSNEIQVTVQPSQQWWTELPARIASARTAVWQRLRRSRFFAGE